MTTDILQKNQDRITVYFDYFFPIFTPCLLKSHGKYSISRLLNKHLHVSLHKFQQMYVRTQFMHISNKCIFHQKIQVFFPSKFHPSASIIYMLGNILKIFLFVFHFFFSVVHPYNYLIEILNTDIQQSNSNDVLSIKLLLEL